MKAKILAVVAVLAVVAMLYFTNGCGNGPGNSVCPTCGTQSGGTFARLTIIPVPEHNATGEPGGPFNSFDISWMDSVNQLDFVSDRIGLAVVVIDTKNNVAVNALEGANGVIGVGDFASSCLSTIPPLQTALGNWTRFACRNAPFSIPGFGANGLFGGFPGAQCCASRANGVNPLSGPDGEEATADGNTLFSANSSSTITVWDLTALRANPSAVPTVIASIPTGQSPDWDGGPNPGFPNATGVNGCIASANGRAFSDPTCGDLRADEMAFNNTSNILAVANGDPALPFVTFIDMSGVVARTSTCPPFNPAITHYGPDNFPSCIIGQVYYDGSPISDSTVALDQAGAPCPDPSNFFNFNPATPVPSGVSGQSASTGGTVVPCHHGPILDLSTAPGNGGTFDPTCTDPAVCAGAVAFAGIGGMAWNATTGNLLVANQNSVVNDPAVGSIDEIDPHHMVNGVDVGPVVIFSLPMNGNNQCLPTSVVQGPGTHFLVGCADHDGIALEPKNEIVIDNPAPGQFTILANIPFVGGVDEVWYNPGDNNYYVAARDMDSGPVLGVINAANNQWIQNVPTNTNSHSVAVDANTNLVYVPSQSGGPCTTQSSNGCILVIGRQ